MSTSPEPEFDLEKLFLPAWAQDAPQANRYADFAGEERSDRKFDDRPGRRPPRRDQSAGGRPGGPGSGGPRPGGGRPESGRPHGEERRGRRPDQRPFAQAAPKPEPLPPLPLAISILPDEKGVESLARQIRVAGRAYPLFDIARLILQKPERLQVRFEVKKGPDAKPLQPLFLCALDDTLWLSEDEAVEHILARHFQTFYQPERTATEPPKGTYTFVAQCGMSGKILGPPNYHDYQTQLHKLHNERFARLPFEAFKARVKIVRDEAVVKQWIEDHSFKTEYNCLNVPEPKKLASRDEVAKHFREVHLANIVKSVESHTLNGAAARQQRSPELQRAIRAITEDQRRFPLQVATVLSQQFAGHGLQFFKVNRTVTHVSVARPRFLDLEATPVSEGVKRIVDFINTHSKCTRRKLMDTLAPAPVAPVAPPTAPAAPAAPAEGVAPVAAPAPAPLEAAPEQTALASDLHWLIHEGHVIEYANGLLETAKKPLPRPPKPEKPVQPEASAATPAAPPAESTEATVPTVEPVAGASAAPPAVPLLEAPAEQAPVVSQESPAVSG